MKSFSLRYVLFFLSGLVGLTVGCGTGSSPSVTGQSGTPPVLTSITPATATAGSTGMVLTATGSSFVPGSEITWNGTERATLYVTSGSLQMNLSASDLATASTAQVGVTNPQTDGGASSATVPFTISANVNPNPVPVLTSINPSSAASGSAATTVSLTGSGFVSNSAVTWNGQTLTSTYTNTTSLSATIPSSDLQNPGSNQIAVVNPSPGGGTSNSVTFVVNATGTSGQSVINLPANDLAWDPINQVIYLSLPSVTGSNGNTIQILNPVNGTLGNSVFAGSEPNLLSVSATSKYLYAGLDGSSNLQRFLLPALTPDINISFPQAGFFGAYVAMDVQASPASDATVAFVLGTPDVSPEEEGGVLIYDNAVQRPDALCGFSGGGCTGPDNEFADLFDSIQWDTSGAEMYALNNEDTGFDFYEIPVTPQGFGAVTDDGALAPGFGVTLHYDATTKMLYTDYGVVIDAATGDKVGQFSASGLAAPDGKNGVIYFIGQPESSFGTSTYTIESFDITHFTPIATTTIQNVIGQPSHFIRWGTNGLAFTTYNYLYTAEQGNSSVPSIF